jgi:hypothetical protein
MLLWMHVIFGMNIKDKSLNVGVVVTNSKPIPKSKWKHHLSSEAIDCDSDEPSPKAVKRCIDIMGKTNANPTHESGKIGFRLNSVLNPAHSVPRIESYDPSTWNLNHRIMYFVLNHSVYRHCSPKFFLKVTSSSSGNTLLVNVDVNPNPHRKWLYNRNYSYAIHVSRGATLLWNQTWLDCDAWLLLRMCVDLNDCDSIPQLRVGEDR